MILDGLHGFQFAVLIYFLLVNSFYLALLLSAATSMLRNSRVTRHELRERLLASEVMPRMSILAPAYNEASTVTESVRALLSLRYQNIEVVLVNDGSADETLSILKREFELTPIHPVFRRQVDSAAVRGIYRSHVKPELVVVDKENGGKADSLNAALNVASGELICAIDADTLIEADALLRMVRPFLESEDVVAVGGTIRVANGSVVRGGRVVNAAAPRRLLPGVQVVEYLRAFLFGRLGWNRLGGNLDHLGCLRPLPSRRDDRRRRLRPRHGGRGHGARGEPPPAGHRARRSQAGRASSPTRLPGPRCRSR